MKIKCFLTVFLKEFVIKPFKSTATVGEKNATINLSARPVNRSIFNQRPRPSDLS